MAKVRPYIIAKLMGLKNITLSPPKNICGSQSLIRVKKLMFNPEASGKRPRIVVMAVNKTGLSLVFPPSITEALKSSLDNKVVSKA